MEMNDLDKQISENIRREIETSGLTKSEIARALGVSRPTVSQYVSGRIQPTLAMLSRLCMSQLLGGRHTRRALTSPCEQPAAAQACCRSFPLCVGVTSARCPPTLFYGRSSF